ncbi:hypothetical protein KI387_008812 [Taxus chinensis]|uniref:GDSL esterase/lipase n=1 Tax=Taxus chinensis TaxID=29808 RepID=A0AA38CTF1_TAXCH|nr:hypothetical protein KI387_008812 [Taxus chinensis]
MFEISNSFYVCATTVRFGRAEGTGDVDRSIGLCFGSKGHQISQRGVRCSASLFNSQLRSLINRLNGEASAQVFTFADSYLMNMGIFSNHAAYGFVDSTNACCGQGENNGVGLCTAASNVCSNRDTHLYWDSYHPSERANKIIVDQFFEGSSSVMSPLNLRQMMKFED